MSALPMATAFADARPLTYGRHDRRRDGEALVREHLPLVRRIAWHVHATASSALEVEDLIQVGLVALIEAAASFEDRGQVEFRQFVKTRLRGAMIDALRRQAAMTRGAIRRRREYRDAVRTLTDANGTPPAEADVAARLAVSIEKLRSDYATAEALRLEPIDEVYADDLPWFASEEPDAFQQLADGELRSALIAAIAALPEREQLVVQLYHVEEMNLEEIGQVLDVSAARVCQIKASAQARLKKALTGQR